MAAVADSLGPATLERLMEDGTSGNINLLTADKPSR